ncbi:MAG: 30S ribosomal protein S2 [Minisyncoccales bacterium]
MLETETKTKSRKQNTEEDFGLDINEMTQAGLCLGHQTSYFHPKMKPYISGIKNNIHLIDLTKTIEKLKEALIFIKQLVSENKILLLVGTKIPARELIKSLASECGLPYVTERWVGGTLTNFPVIKKRIDYFNNLEEKRNKGELDKYTKKEKALFDKELKNLEIKFAGIKNLTTLPDAVFVVDIKKDAAAVTEARKKGIKVIAIVDTNANPELVDFPIPTNDDAISSVKYILDKVKEVIIKAKPKSVK